MPMAREVAKRVFAKEFNASTLTYKESEDQFAPAYVLTPTGAKCNRVFIVGTLTEKENVGEEQDTWRARVTDPTGAFVVYASQFSPDAAQALSDIEPPSFVAVIGKPRVFKTQDGEIRVYVRPEAVLPVDTEARDRWVLDAINATADRLIALKAGTDADAKKAEEYYHPDIKEYKEMLLNAAKSLKQMEVSVVSAR
ncbi:MAG TPA: DNA-binding protein [Methanocella sp.]|uniref:RPA family protein n=1 Tax=Methanocella sp. TaxID=2052833 RepID=UPI002BBE8FA0|nr:DNA-binding protein [Methanocella sp.]HTY90019.1 DNA-binding protein [Methanocella sp.]